MSDNFDSYTADIEMAAAELIARVKSGDMEAINLAIVDDSCVWRVTLKRLGIQHYIESEHKPITDAD